MQAELNFTPSGYGFEESDLPRIKSNARKVWDIMIDQQFHDLQNISERLNMPHSSVTACVRGFRNNKNGGHTVNKKKMPEGHFLYQLIPASPEQARINKQYRNQSKNIAYLEAYIDGLAYALDSLDKHVKSKNGWPNSPSLIAYKDNLSAHFLEIALQKDEKTKQGQ